MTSLPTKPVPGADWTDYGAALDAVAREVKAAVDTLVSLNGVGQVAVYTANSGTSLTLPDVTVATTSAVTLTANAQLIFPLVAVGREFDLFLTQDATGSRTVAWPSSVRWANGGTAPTLTTGAGKTDRLSFLSIDGVSWIGEVVGANIPASLISVTNPVGDGSGGSTGGSTGGTATTLATEPFTGTTGAWPGQWTLSVSANHTLVANKGRATTSTTAYGGGASALLSGMTATADSETYVEFTTPATSLEQYVFVGARANALAAVGKSNPLNGYGIEISQTAGGARLLKFVGDVPTDFSGGTLTAITSGGLTVSTVYKVRLRLDGARIRWRVWSGATEPTTWMQDYTDTTSPYLTAGKTFLSLQNGSAAAARSVDFDNLTVTDGTATTATGITVTIDDTALTYTGTGWATGTDAGTYKSGDHYTQVAGDAASFTATFVAGGTFALVCKKAPQHGIVFVQIDGGTATSVDLYSATSAYQQTVFTSSALAAGSHVIKVTSTSSQNASASGAVCEVDCLILTNAVQGTTGDAAGGTTPTTGDTSTSTTPTGTTPTPTGFLTRGAQGGPDSTKIFLNGSRYKAAGGNLPWIFGLNPSRQTSAAQNAQMFKNARPNSIFRIFIFQGISLAAFDAILTAARPYGHRFVVCLTDYGGGIEKRDDTFWGGGWISTGWRDNWLTPVVNRYKSEPLIGWWEWCNEPSVSTAFRNFCDAAGAYVRNTLGDQHLIAAGTMSPYGVARTAWELVAASPYIDLMSTHDYDQTQFPSGWSVQDEASATAKGKAFYVGEIGITTANNATVGIAQKLAGYKAAANVCAVIYWSYSASQDGSTTASDGYDKAVFAPGSATVAGPVVNVINQFNMLS